MFTLQTTLALSCDEHCGDIKELLFLSFYSFQKKITNFFSFSFSLARLLMDPSDTIHLSFLVLASPSLAVLKAAAAS